LKWEGENTRIWKHGEDHVEQGRKMAMFEPYVLRGDCRHRIIAEEGRDESSMWLRHCDEKRLSEASRSNDRDDR
jgi:hypothetical protein